MQAARVHVLLPEEPGNRVLPTLQETDGELVHMPA